ncbi:MAG: hypothetical protein MHMPM18_002824 [Marteilia pararefringens]
MPLTSLPANVTKSLRFAKKLQDDDKLQFAMFCRHYARKCLINESRQEYELLISTLDAKIKSAVQSLTDQSQSIVFPDYSDEIEDYVDKLLIDALSRSRNNSSQDKDSELAEEIIVAYAIIMQFDPSKKESKEILQKQAAASNLHIELRSRDALQPQLQPQPNVAAAAAAATHSTKIEDKHQMKPPTDQGVEMGENALLEEPDVIESYDPLKDLSDDVEEEEKRRVVDDLEMESLKIQSHQQLGMEECNKEMQNVEQVQPQQLSHPPPHPQSSSSSIGDTQVEKRDQIIDEKKASIGQVIKNDADETNEETIPENVEENAFDANYVVTNDVENTLAIRNMKQVSAANNHNAAASAAGPGKGKTARELTSEDIGDFLMEICETTMRDKAIFIGENEREFAAKLFMFLSDCFEIIINRRISMYGAATLGLLTFSENLLRKEFLNNHTDNDALKVQSLLLNIRHYLGRLFVSKANNLKDGMILMHQDKIEKYLVNAVLSFTQKNYIIGISWSLMTIKFIICSLDIQ